MAKKSISKQCERCPKCKQIKTRKRDLYPPYWGAWQNKDFFMSRCKDCKISFQWHKGQCDILNIMSDSDWYKIISKPTSGVAVLAMMFMPKKTYGSLDEYQNAVKEHAKDNNIVFRDAAGNVVQF